MSRVIALAFLGCSAFGGPIFFYTAPGASVTSNNTTLPVSAEADFVLRGNLLIVTLYNRIVNPTSVLQNLSGLFFDVYTAEGLYGGAASIAGLSGTGVTVGKDGSLSTSPLVSVPLRSWSIIDGTLLTALGTGGPDYTVIGAPNVQTDRYSNNGSFSATPHNPFLQSGATFTIAFDGTPLTGVNNVVFSFGTDPGVTAPAVPEPATFSLVGLTLVVVGIAARKLRRR